MATTFEPVRWLAARRGRVPGEVVAACPGAEPGEVLVLTRLGLTAVRTSDGAVLWVDPEAHGGVVSLGDGRAAAGTRAGEVRILEARTGEILERHGLHRGPCAALGARGGGGVLFTSGLDGWIQELEVSTGRVLRSRGMPGGLPARPRFLPGERYLVHGGSDLVVLDLRTRQVAVRDGEPGDEVVDLDLDVGRGCVVALVRGPGGARLRELTIPGARRVRDHAAPADAARVWVRGARWVVAGEGGTVCLVDPGSGEARVVGGLTVSASWGYPTRFSDALESAAVAPDGTWLVYRDRSYDRDALRGLDLGSGAARDPADPRRSVGQRIRALVAGEDAPRVAALDFDAGGALLAVLGGGGGRRPLVWDLSGAAARGPLAETVPPEPGPGAASQPSREELRLETGALQLRVGEERVLLGYREEGLDLRGPDGRSRGWLDPGELCAPGLVHATFSPEGGLLAVARMGGTVRVLEAASGRDVARFRSSRGEIRAAALSEDGSRLVAVGFRPELFHWEADGPGAVSSVALERVDRCLPRLAVSGSGAEATVLTSRSGPGGAPEETLVRVDLGTGSAEAGAALEEPVVGLGYDGEALVVQDPRGPELEAGPGRSLGGVSASGAVLLVPHAHAPVELVDATTGAVRAALAAEHLEAALPSPELQEGLEPLDASAVRLGAVSPGGAVALALHGGEVLLWRPGGEEAAARVRTPLARQWFTRMVFSPDGDRLAVGAHNAAEEPRVAVLDVPLLQMAADVPGCGGFGCALVWEGSALSSWTLTPSELLRVPVLGEDGRPLRARGVPPWQEFALEPEPEGERHLRRVLLLVDPPVDLAALFVDDGTVAGLRHRLRLVSLGGETRATVSLPGLRVVDAVLLPDRERLLLGGERGELRVVSASDGGLLAEARAGGGALQSLALHPDERHVAVGHADGAVAVYSLEGLG